MSKSRQRQQLPKAPLRKGSRDANLKVRTAKLSRLATEGETPRIVASPVPRRRSDSSIATQEAEQ